VSGAPSIVVVEHRREWADDFVHLAGRLADALGPAALAIQHIGSTAVPGLVAKDVIDIQVSIADLDDPALGADLARAGFVLWEDLRRDHEPAGRAVPPIELRKRFAGNAPGLRRTNVHFRVPGTFNHRYALLCRDYLRTHPDAAAAYGDVKRHLARLFPHDQDAYYDIKDPVFDVLMAGAEAWAASTGWRDPLAAPTLPGF
jgi:GrpB-like predicted nucleotidyltransferase (UPF0157 family)